MYRLPFREIFTWIVTELYPVFFDNSRNVRAGTVVCRISVENVVKSLHVEAYALYFVIDEPLRACDGKAGAVSEVVVVLSPVKSFILRPPILHIPF